MVNVEMNNSPAAMGRNGVPECAAKSTVAQNNCDSDDNDDDDDKLMQGLLRLAANDPDQPSLAHWQVLSGFSGKAVEDAYQAGQVMFLEPKQAAHINLAPCSLHLAPI